MLSIIYGKKLRFEIDRKNLSLEEQQEIKKIINKSLKKLKEIDEPNPEMVLFVFFTAFFCVENKFNGVYIYSNLGEETDGLLQDVLFEVKRYVKTVKKGMK